MKVRVYMRTDAAIRAGVDQGYHDVDCGDQVPAEEREVIADALLSPSGGSVHVIGPAAPTVEAIRAWAQARIRDAAEAAAKRAVHEAANEERARKFVARFEGHIGDALHVAQRQYRGGMIADHKYTPEYAELYGGADPIDGDLAARRRAIIDEVNRLMRQMDAAAEAARDAEVEAEEAAAARAVTEWIETHGSERLKLAARHGVECGAIYRDERLALERPGWRYWSEVEGSWETDKARNPPLAALEALEAAKASVPDAKLLYCTREEDEDLGEEWKVYALEAKFLGKDIVKLLE